MAKFTIGFILERETKGAVRYQETDSNGNQVEMADAKLGTVYIRKSALGSTIPKALKLTVEF